MVTPIKTVELNRNFKPTGDSWPLNAALPVFGNAAVQGTEVFELVDLAADSVTFTNACGTQTLTHAQLATGAIPTEIVSCDGRRHIPHNVPASWCRGALHAFDLVIKLEIQNDYFFKDGYTLFSQIQQHADQCPGEAREAQALRRAAVDYFHRDMDDRVCPPGQYSWQPGYGSEAICTPYAN